MPPEQWNVPLRYSFFLFLSGSHFTSLIHFNKFIITLLCLTTLIAPIRRLFTKRRCCCRKDKQIKEFKHFAVPIRKLRLSLHMEKKRDWKWHSSQPSLCLLDCGDKEAENNIFVLNFQRTLQCSGCRGHIKEITAYIYLLYFIRHDGGATVWEHCLKTHLGWKNGAVNSFM